MPPHIPKEWDTLYSESAVFSAGEMIQYTSFRTSDTINYHACDRAFHPSVTVTDPF